MPEYYDGFWEFCFAVEIDLFMILSSSKLILINWFTSIFSVSFTNPNQNIVSSPSLREILSLWIKSALLSGAWASRKFAPMEVPLRTSWRDKSKLLFSFSSLLTLITPTASSNDFWRAGLCFLFKTDLSQQNPLLSWNSESIFSRCKVKTMFVTG